MIISFFMDYPGRESAVPEWLAQQIGCNNYTDYGGGCSPDCILYANPH